MMPLVYLWAAVVGLAVALPGLLSYAARLRREAEEWDSIAAHHEQMAALHPPTRR